VLRRGAWGLGGISFIAIVLAIVALFARSSAQREAAVNHSLVLAADAEQAQDNGEGDLALALALEAVSLDQPPPEALRTLSTIALGPGTRAVFKAHDQAVQDIAFGPDGTSALSGSCGALDSDGECTQGELILWSISDSPDADVGIGDELRRFEGHSGWVNSVALGPDGQTALSGSDDGLVILWDVETGEAIHRFKGHAGGVNSVALSPDGRTALSGSDDSTLILWDVATGEPIRRYEAHTAAVNCVGFSPDGQTVLSGSGDTTLILWSAETGAASVRFEGHTWGVIGATFSPDGRRVLSTGDDHALRMWDVETGEQTHQMFFGADVGAPFVSPDGRTAILLPLQGGNYLRLVDIKQWRETGRLVGGRSELKCMSTYSGGKMALSGSTDGTIRLWKYQGQAKSRRFETDGVPLTAVDVSFDGRHLLTGDAVGDAVLWDVARGQAIRRFEGDGFGINPGEIDLGPGGKRALVGAADLFGGSGESSLVLWDVESGEEIRRFEGHRDLVRSVAFGPDGRTGLGGSQSQDSFDGDLILWDLETGEQVRRFDTAEDVAHVVFSADGKRALTGSAFSSSMTLWDVATGRAIRRFEWHAATPVLAVAFGPDETTALSASADGSLTLWDIVTGDVIRRYLGHDNAVWCLAVSPDGRLVLSGSDDTTVILWDFETGEELRRFSEHTAVVLDVGFGPDSQTAYSVSMDGALIEWQIADLPLDELVEWTHANRYVRDLTCEEREQYRVEPLCDAGAVLPTIVMP
jgi:WD40 repeat protein